MRIRTGALAVLAAAIVAVLSAASASAAGAGAVSVTEHIHNQVIFSNPDVNPCTGAPGIVTGIATNSYALAGLTAGTSYDYQVLAVCPSGSSVYSSVFTFATA